MRLFKYRGGTFDRDLNSLSDNFFWAPTRECLNDPCEGIFGQKVIQNQIEFFLGTFSKTNYQAKEAYDGLKNSLMSVFDFVDKSGVYSLSQTPLEELLWAHYGVSHTGFCIEFDLDCLVKYEKNDYKVVTVNYKDTPDSVSIEDLNNQNRIFEKMLGIKSKAWSYEKEVRVITSFSGSHEYDFRAVKAIYFGLRMDANQKIKIMKTLKGREIKYHQIVLKENSYKFDTTEVQDPFADAPLYKYSIAPIADGAITPEYVNEKYKAHIAYLYKAAEIVRREPDCTEVEMVEFSTSRGDEKKPVIFVQYQRKENRLFNHYLTLNEIDAQYSKIKDLS